jgi:predicted RNase H-like HicB family nuclease
MRRRAVPDKDLSHYRALPYTRRVRPFYEDKATYWLASVAELPGCEVEGATKHEAFANLSEVFEDYIAGKLEWGSPIPEPTRWSRVGPARPVRQRIVEFEVRRIEPPKIEVGTDAVTVGEPELITAAA